MKYPPVQYHDYLQLDKILEAQSRRSLELGQGAGAHDEMLFIIVHQTYELWFKQMIFELDSVMTSFGQSNVDESQMGTAVARLERIVEIQKFINGQIDILETMTPLDFLDFRDFLFPASGFQSLSWRVLETKLGLKIEQRLAFSQGPFYSYLKPAQQETIQQALAAPSLFDLTEKWLERTPFLQTDSFDFWKSYQQAVDKLLAHDRKILEQNPRLSAAELEKNLQQLDGTKKTFEALFSESEYKNLQKENYFRLSQKAIRAALLIQLYRDEPILQMPYRLIKALTDLDEHMTQWRYRHSMMAHRMLGKKIGTGGSSGTDYLKSATEKHKIFTDFFNLTTFLIPRSMIPTLPKELRRSMSYVGGSSASDR